VFVALVGYWDLILRKQERQKGTIRVCPPNKQNLLVKELSRFIGMGVMALSAAKLYAVAKKDDSVDIDIDPRSSTFGSITTENKTFSIYGRYGSAIRTIIQAAGGVRMIGGKKDVLGTNLEIRIKQMFFLVHLVEER